MERYINQNTVLSFIKYHRSLYDDFVQNQDFTKLDDFILYLDIIHDFRNRYLKDDVKGRILLEVYITEIKANAYKLLDIADSYFIDEYYNKVNDYCDVVLEL